MAAEQFHNERVMSIKCQSLRRSKFDRGLDNFSEEIHVIYPTNICLINGVTLIQTLRSYRSELARGKYFYFINKTHYVTRNGVFQRGKSEQSADDEAITAR